MVHYHHSISFFLYIEYLKLLSWAPIVFLSGPSGIGFGIPFLISVLYIFYEKTASHWKKHGFHLLVLVSICAIYGFITHKWINDSLHMIAVPDILWPLFVFLDDDLNIMDAYVGAFISSVIPDAYFGCVAADWSRYWYCGIGAAGWHDGLFQVPLTALIDSALLVYVARPLLSRMRLISFTKI